ncbi:Insulin-like growth factor binding protein, N-terminal [Pseudocohnilembus persalinus]|uniref:Insulin-like growth factor binding protein, N-terminal n=1 Tax=Pseudocohnilembus persalinus TaxID=266149 RepID=A0A0V0QQU0_PSEPJ|nr:Insulin-like growth factor binding protein, N-terminal [Pseudocohnilembus persalinus]|eukprot:KRX04410.1 Insulin-like growth factor binding protein, N-terminal [Pseudocohnilembus persalinus]
MNAQLILNFLIAKLVDEKKYFETSQYEVKDTDVTQTRKYNSIVQKPGFLVCGINQQYYGDYNYLVGIELVFCNFQDLNIIEKYNLFQSDENETEWVYQKCDNLDFVQGVKYYQNNIYLYGIEIKCYNQNNFMQNNMVDKNIHSNETFQYDQSIFSCGNSINTVSYNTYEVILSYRDYLCKKNYVCNQNCSNCQSENYCTKCNSKFYLQNGQCKECPYFCEDCTNNQNCESCPTGSNRDIEQNCKCKDQYYDDGQLICQICPFPCFNCQDVSTCLNCVTSDPIRNKSDFCACPDGYYDDLQNSQCQKCKFPCQTCSSENNCLSCVHSVNERIVNEMCKCPDYFYDDGDSSECQACLFPCLTCENASVCYSCISSERISDNFCACPDQYYDDGNSSKCQQCPFPCLNCTDNENCSTCVYSNPARNKDEFCSCPDQFFDDACLFPCSNCKDSLTCLSCVVSNPERIIDEFCACPGNYYDDQSTEQCQVCPFPCQNCQDEMTCTSCVSSKPQRNELDFCSCPESYYDNGLETQCQVCIFPCLNCISQNICSICVISDPVRLENQNCICPQGYFDDGINSQCQKCQGPCGNCLDFDTCLTCYKNDQNRILEKQCQCKDGYYQESPSQLCKNLPCSSKCKTCITGFTVCSQCQGENRKKLKYNCECLDGYHDNFGKDINCSKCPSLCSKCYSNSYCSECQSDIENLKYYVGKCQCKLGYKYNEVKNTCQKCYRYKNQCLFKCVHGTEQNEELQICQIINKQKSYVVTYYKIAMTQIQFYDEQLYIQVSNVSSYQTIDYNGINKKPGYILCGINQQYWVTTIYIDIVYVSGLKLVYCKLEDYSINQVETLFESPNGSWKNLSCNNQEYISGIIYYSYSNIGYISGIDILCGTSHTILTNQFLPNGDDYPPVEKQYDDFIYSCGLKLNIYINDILYIGQKYIASYTDYLCTFKYSCHDNCSVCHSLSQCIQCKDKYFLDSGNCENCPYYCENCSSSQDCLSCPPNSYRDINQNCQCNEQYYQVALGIIECQQCQFPCLNCSSQLTCLSCVSGRILKNGSCVCPDGLYEDQNNACQPCPFPCKNCLNESTCSSCVESEPSRNVQNFCACPEQYYDDGINPQCQACQFPCLNCQNAFTCSSCVPSNPQRIVGDFCACPEKYYDGNHPQCSQCLFPCSNCVDDKTCTSCVSSNPQRIVDEFCSCPEQYYDDQIDQCQSCPFPCLNCTDQQTCLTCVVSIPQRIVDEFCACPDNYYDDQSNGQCQQCLFPCQNCQDQLICTTCVSSEPKRNELDFCSCPEQHYDNGSDSQCQACIFPCLNCISQNECSSCVISDPARLESQNCICPQGYFDDGENQQCQKCQGPCGNCLDLDTCLTCYKNDQNRILENKCQCKDGYYQEEPNQLCKRCDFQCKTCEKKGGCTSCHKDNLILPYCKNTFRNHFYLKEYDENSFIYLPCSSKCKTCITGFNVCSQCQGENRKKLRDNCQCLDGYHDNFGKDINCSKCPSLCSKCYSSSYCSECQSDIENLKYYVGKCQCKLGYKYNEVKNTCQKCYRYKNQCLFKCVHGTEQNEELQTQFQFKELKDYITPPDQLYTTVQFDATQDLPGYALCGILQKFSGQTLTGVNIKLCSFNQQNSPKIKKIFGGQSDNSWLKLECDQNQFATGLKIYTQGSEQSRILKGINIKCGLNYLDDQSNFSGFDQLEFDYDIGIYSCGIQIKIKEQINNIIQGISDIYCNVDYICEDCPQGSYRNLSENCGCNSGYYDIGLTLCVQCQFPCLQCNGLNYCETCVSSERVPPLCNCPSGQYQGQDFQDECLKCMPYCQECQDGETCQSCIGNDQNRDVNNNCQCKDGYYQNDSQFLCKMCDPQCKTCNKSGECTSCHKENQLLPDCKTTIGASQFFLDQLNFPNDEIENQVLYCSIQCKSCVKYQDNCTECRGENRLDEENKCMCKNGFHDNFNQDLNCSKCPKLCSKCLGKNYCTECNKNIDKLAWHSSISLIKELQQ